MKKILVLILILFSATGCSQSQQNNTSTTKPKSLINPSGTTIATRIQLPKGYKRQKHNKNSFAYYLSHLELKPHGSKVKYYNGSKKEVEGVYMAVVDMDIGKRDLQQCADAIMRLRAEYLFKTGQQNKIHFNFTNGFRVDYNKWKQGYRIAVKGHKTYWVKTASPSNSYNSFRKYLNIIFAYAGSLSLSKELVSVPLKNIKIGDIFIHGGTPGHAVIVVDTAVDSNNNKIFLLAQSYMPAQEIQILINPNNNKLNPWYSVKEIENILFTPEYTFDKTELKRFPD